MIELLKEYHNRGFDIIEIAEDDDKPNAGNKQLIKTG